MAYSRPRQEPAEIYRGGGRVPLDANQFREGAFHSRPDPRFGGNISRANVGAQYPQGGVDRRYENYQRPQRVDYTRNIPRQTGTPNFRPPYGAPGQPSYPEWMQQIDPFHTGPYPPKKHPNPRMRGMGGGLGGLQEQAAIDPSDWRVIQQIIKAGGNPDDYMQTAEFGGYGYNPDPNKTYDDYYTGQDIIDMEILPGVGYDPADEYYFDRKKGFPGRKFGRGYKKPVYSARGGIMSLWR